jgi:hypothetical protein
MSKQRWKKDFEPRAGYYNRPQKPNINADLYNARII